VGVNITQKEAGMERSRKGFFLITILYVVFFLTFPAVAAHCHWLNTYGGLGFDYAYSIQQTQDQGFIVAGFTDSYGAGSRDAWVMKLDNTGAIIWQKTYGGEDDDGVKFIQQAQDGGYVVAGYTRSYGAGSRDAWVMKLDNTGAIIWQKTYGGESWEQIDSVQQTADGGYIVTGLTQSFGAGESDVWVMKLDSTGTVAWQKMYGGSGNDWASLIQQTADGGYIVVGGTSSFGAGKEDAWVIKLDSTGTVIWQKMYGGSDYDCALFVQQTSDSGYIVSGSTGSYGAGSHDAWVMKLDSTGTIVWQKTYGGANNDNAHSIRQTADGGYIMVGYTSSFGAGKEDTWVVRLDGTGTVIWQKTYGGAGEDLVNSISQTQDQGYIIAGYTGLSAVTREAWVMKLDSSGSAGSCAFEGVPTAAVFDTEVTGVDTTAIPVDTSVTGADTAATVGDASASAIQWCPLTDDTQGLKVGATRKKKGEGTIVSAEGLIACPGTCQEEYNKGLTVTLYADPSDLSTFLGWKHASLGCDGTDPCTVTMDKKKSVKAVFQGPNKLKVVTTLKKGATGMVTSGDGLINCPGDCEELYILNAPVTLTAIAGDGSSFVKWTGRPCKDVLTNECTFTMDKNTTVKAIFQINPE
jgi:hypothetical protein